MASTALNLTECVLPPAPLRQWVLTFHPFGYHEARPFAWRGRLGFDAELFGALSRIFVRTVLAFYTRRMKAEGIAKRQSGAVVALQRTASDLKLSPHIHAVFLDGVYREQGEQVLFHELPRLTTRQVGEVLEQAVRRIARHLARRGLLGEAGGCDDDEDAEPSIAEGHAELCASAASGQSPPAGPELRRKSAPLAPLGAAPLQFDKPLCASKDGFSLHAATRAGAMDPRGREALLKYDPWKSPAGDVLRPPIAQERVTQGPDGLVRIALKRAFSDGTIAIDLDPLSLLCRLAASVPAPKVHTVRYDPWKSPTGDAGVLGSASKLRSRIVPKAPPVEQEPSGDAVPDAPEKPRGCRYRSWTELLGTLGIDGLVCPKCQGRMRVMSLVREPDEIRRFLRAAGEPTEPPERAPARGPPFWASRALRIRSGTDAA